MAIHGLCPECFLRGIELEQGQLLRQFDSHIEEYVAPCSLGDFTDWKTVDLLDFATPNGLRFHVSSLSSPNFASSYTLGSVGLVDGSLSYLYSSLPLKNLASSSKNVDLRRLVPGYRLLQDLRSPDQPEWWEIWHQGKRVDQRGGSCSTPLFCSLGDTRNDQELFSMVVSSFLDLHSKLSICAA